MPLLSGYPADQAALSEASNALDRILSEVAAEYAERLAPAIDQIWKNEVERLRADLRTWLVSVGDGSSGLGARRAEKTFDEVVIGNGWRLERPHGFGGTVARWRPLGDGLQDRKLSRSAAEVTGQREVLQPLLYALAAEQLYRRKGRRRTFVLCDRSRRIPQHMDAAFRPERATKRSVFSQPLTPRSPTASCRPPRARMPAAAVTMPSSADLMKKNGSCANRPGELQRPGPAAGGQMIPSRDVEASFFLEASAGTGKTTQLIEQIVRCVAAGTKLATRGGRHLYARGGGRNEIAAARGTGQGWTVVRRSGTRFCWHDSRFLRAAAARASRRSGRRSALCRARSGGRRGAVRGRIQALG